MGTGAEVHLLLEAYEQLNERGIGVRVVNIPSWELIEDQLKDYREKVLFREVTARASVEAGSPIGWERYKGIRGEIMGIARFGASAPAKELFMEFGFLAENVVKRSEGLLVHK